MLRISVQVILEFIIASSDVIKQCSDSNLRKDIKKKMNRFKYHACHDINKIKKLKKELNESFMVFSPFCGFL